MEGMGTTHIPEAEAVRDFPGLLARARAGEEIVIEKEASPAVVLRSAAPQGRLLSEAITLADVHGKEAGCEPEMDEDFAADLAEIVRDRKPRDMSVWD